MVKKKRMVCYVIVTSLLQAIYSINICEWDTPYLQQYSTYGTLQLHNFQSSRPPGLPAKSFNAGDQAQALVLLTLYHNHCSSEDWSDVRVREELWQAVALWEAVGWWRILRWI